MEEIDWDSLYLKLWPMIKDRAGARVGLDFPDHEDIAQDVFLGLLVLVRSGRYRGEARLKTIAYAITEARIMDALRKKYGGRHRNFTLREARDLAISDLFEADVENRALFMAMMKKLDVLTDRQRSIFLLHGVGEMPLAEAARRLNISPNYAGNVFLRAKGKLAAALKNHWTETRVLSKPRFTVDGLVAWVDKAFNAYACLGRKIGHWTDGVEQAAAEARTEIKKAIVRSEAHEYESTHHSPIEGRSHRRPK